MLQLRPYFDCLGCSLAIVILIHSMLLMCDAPMPGKLKMMLEGWRCAMLIVLMEHKWPHCLWRSPSVHVQTLICDRSSTPRQGHNRTMVRYQLSTARCCLINQSSNFIFIPNSCAHACWPFPPNPAAGSCIY